MHPPRCAVRRRRCHPEAHGVVAVRRVHSDSLIGLLSTTLPPEASAQLVGGFRGAPIEGRSGLMQPIPAEVFNVARANRAWVDRRCVPQALAEG